MDVDSRRLDERPLNKAPPYRIATNIYCEDTWKFFNLNDSHFSLVYHDERDCFCLRNEEKQKTKTHKKNH